MNSNLAYQEEFWEELINGRAVAMSPAATNHNRVASMIFHIFQGYLDGKSCEPFADNETVYLTKTDHFVPDCMVVCDKDKIKSDGVHGAPDLVVEVLSPSTARRDRGHKKMSMRPAAFRNIGSWILSTNPLKYICCGTGNISWTICISFTQTLCWKK